MNSATPVASKPTVRDTRPPTGLDRNFRGRDVGLRVRRGLALDQDARQVDERRRARQRLRKIVHRVRRDDADVDVGTGGERGGGTLGAYGGHDLDIGVLAGMRQQILADATVCAGYDKVHAGFLLLVIRLPD